MEKIETKVEEKNLESDYVICNGCNKKVEKKDAHYWGDKKYCPPCNHFYNLED